MTLKVTRFFAKWSVLCHTIQSIFKRVMETTEGVEFVEIDIDKEPEIVSSMNIRSVPTIVFEKNNKVMDSMVGFSSEQDIRSKIGELVNE